MPLSHTKHIYKLIPRGALALKLRCKTSSTALAILGIDPSGNPISSCWAKVSDRAPSGGGRDFVVYIQLTTVLSAGALTISVSV